MSVILVSHDLGVIAETCDRVAVMYAGQIVEMADDRDAADAPAPSLYRWPAALAARRTRARAI